MQQDWVIRVGKCASDAWQKSYARRFVDEYPRLALLLGSLLFATFSAAWLTLQNPDFLRGFDFVRMHAFYKSYYREALLAGRLPLWNPYVGLGRPFLADIETQTLYPPNLFVLLFGVNCGIPLLLVLHQAIAIGGGTCLGRKLGADAVPSFFVGVGFALASPFTARLAAGMLPVYFSLCWWPVLLWLGASLQDGWNRRDAAKFAAVACMAILAGNPPIVFVEFLGLFAFLAFRVDWPGVGAGWRIQLRNHVGVLLAVILGAGLAAVQILPFAELIRQGNRPLNSLKFAVADGMPPASWLSLIFPTSIAFGPNWEYDLYCGLITLFAATGAVFLWRDRNVRGLLGLGLTGALLGVGDRAPFLSWLSHIVPGASALRLPSRYGILFVTALLGMAAVSLSRRPARSVLPILLCFVLSASWIVWLEPYVIGSRENSGYYYATHLIALGAAAVLVAIWHNRALRPESRMALACILGVFCTCDWLWAIHLQAPVYSLYGYRTEEKSVRADLERYGLLVPGAAPPRISFYPSELCENAGMSGGFSTINSYVNPSLSRVWTYLHVTTGVPGAQNDFIRLPQEIDDNADRLGSVNMTATLDRRTRRLIVRRPSDPRLYIAYDAEVVPDWRVAEQRMAEGYKYHEKVLLEAEAMHGYAPATGTHMSEAVITNFEPERITVRTHSEIPGILVLGEAWYPGWQAVIGGKGVDVFPVNGWMRGVVIPSGDNEVRFTYHSRFLGLGFGASLVCALVLVGFLVC
jgi:hypothetical protein